MAKKVRRNSSHPARRARKSAPNSKSSHKAENEKRLRKQMLMDERFALIEYHARIIANWRTRASADQTDMLLSQATRLNELVASLRIGQDHAMGGYDLEPTEFGAGARGLKP